MVDELKNRNHDHHKHGSEKGHGRGHEKGRKGKKSVGTVIPRPILIVRNHGRRCSTYLERTI